MDQIEYRHSSKDVLRQIRYAMRESFTGSILFDRYSVFFQEGSLLTVRNTEDRFWLLRRLFCNRFIDEEYANQLQDSEQKLELVLFPEVPKPTWEIICKERAQQNLFELLFLQAEGRKGEDSAEARSLLSGLNLDEFTIWRERLYMLRSRISRIWLKPKNVDSLTSGKSISLPELIAQSPSEEFETLKNVYDLIEKGELAWGENLAALDGELTADEEGLFADHDPFKITEHFVVPKEHLDRFYLSVEGEQQRVMQMLAATDSLLTHYASSFGKNFGGYLSRVQRQADPQGRLAVTNRGKLVLKDPLLAKDCFLCLKDLLFLLLKAPEMKSRQKEYHLLLDEWVQKWAG